MTKIHLRVQTTAVSMYLAKPLDWEGTWRLGTSMVRLREFTNLELPPELGAPEQLTDRRVWLDIEGGALKLTKINISQGALVSIIRDESGYIDIRTLNKPFEGALELSGSPVVSAGPAPGSKIPIENFLFDPPTIVTFQGTGHPAIPAQLRISPLEKLQLRRVRIDNMSLFTETTNAAQQSSFTSGITEGTMTLLDTRETLDLKVGDPLHLKGASGVISEVEIGPEGLQLLFDGDVCGMFLGTPGNERNLKPTLLEYLYHQERLGFFCGAVTFLWGLIWSGRRLFSA
jgi:hypothetical protein